jgi:hypothetical protein
MQEYRAREKKIGLHQLSKTIYDLSKNLIFLIALGDLPCRETPASHFLPNKNTRSSHETRFEAMQYRCL